VSWKTLAVLGLSGGLVPSTSAIIVLLGAIQLNRIAFGGLLILAFGIGMAIALVSVGLGMVALRDRAFGKMDGNAVIQRARILIVPIAAVAVLLIGVFLVIRAGIEIGDL
jgi:nickel/cobalt exporter